MIKGEVKVVITTPAFRAGQAAAWDDFHRDSTGPNDAILDRMDPEFAAGYRDEWNTYCVVARARAQEKQP